MTQHVVMVQLNRSMDPWQDWDRQLIRNWHAARGHMIVEFVPYESWCYWHRSYGWCGLRLT